MKISFNHKGTQIITETENYKCVLNFAPLRKNLTTKYTKNAQGTQVGIC